jgi:hypothetical protein
MKTCENCGCRVYALGCVNCNEEAYMRDAEEREANFQICGCGRRFDRRDTVTDECESCYELRLGAHL